MGQPTGPTEPEAAFFQAGVFTRTQAYDAGWTPRQVRRRLEVGHWRVVGGIAIGPSALPTGPWQLAYAVILSWPDAVVSHELAAVLHGFPVPAPQTGVATVAPDRGLRGSRLRARRLPLQRHEIGWIRNVPLTTPRRTAVDLLAAMPWDHARDLFAWASTHGVLTPTSLASSVELRRNRPGTPQLRRLLRASASGSLSAAEDRLHEVLGAAGLVGWAANVPIVVGGRTVAVADVLFARARLVVQVDGWRSHGSRAMFQRDRTQQNVLAASGYTILRFTWDDVTRRSEEVVRTIRAALAKSG